MSEARYPALQISASAASNAAQQRFLRMTRVHLGLLACIAVATGISGLPTGAQTALALLTVTLLLGALGISWASRIGRFDDQWFATRALAENVKTAVWRYMMFPSDSKTDDDRAFLKALEEIRHRLPEDRAKLGEYRSHGPEITPWMERNRTAAFDERVRTFREERLRDQRAWYTAKARANSASERRLWAAILCLEMVGVLSGLAQAWLLLSVNPVGGIAAVSAGFIAWLQTKRYSDLASAYTVASDDLARLDAQFDAVVNPIEFERLVREVEAAVSREHSLWVSRRMP